MDMRMPVMDGYEATRQIKHGAHQKTAGTAENNIPRTIVIAITASAFEEEQAKILLAGCDDLVHKPFRQSILFDKMAQHLGVRYLYQEENHSLSPRSTTRPWQLTPADLRIMPVEWVEQVYTAAACVNEELILELIEQIPDTAPGADLAHFLTDLVHNLRLDLIVDLTQPVEF
jgi:CheY-like chemotaxis protein